MNPENTPTKSRFTTLHPCFRSHLTTWTENAYILNAYIRNSSTYTFTGIKFASSLQRLPSHTLKRPHTPKEAQPSHEKIPHPKGLDSHIAHYNTSPKPFYDTTLLLPLHNRGAFNSISHSSYPYPLKKGTFNFICNASNLIAVYKYTANGSKVGQLLAIERTVQTSYKSLNKTCLLSFPLRVAAPPHSHCQQPRTLQINCKHCN